VETSVIDDESRAYCAAEEIRNFIRAFEECTLPKSEWTHAAHLTVAMWYLMERSEIEATTLIRNGILRYNGANGIKTTANSGYHETITLFWTRLVSKHLSETDAGASIVEVANGVIRAFGNKDTPFDYYSRDRLLSLEARMRWVEPDLKPI
jgi:hypothetical protein